MPKDCEHCFAGCEPFSGLCPREAGGAPSGVRHRKLAKAETLFLQGDVPESVYVLRRGLVKLYRGAKPGRQATVRVVHPGELFGCTSLLCGAPYSLSAEGLRESELCVFSAAVFTGILDREAAFARGLLARMARELRSVRLDLISRCELDSSGKIAAQLLDMDGRAPAVGGRGLRITRTALGDMSGMVQETVSRVLGRLEAAGLIEREGRVILIRDREGLRSLAQY